MSMFKNGLWLGALLFLAGCLQGCEIESIAHHAALWRTESSYILNFQFIKPGEPMRKAILNSCEVKELRDDLRCSGNGVCKPWSFNKTRTWRSNGRGGYIAPMTFCECDRDWADPECRTRRKSQTTAWLLSLVGGFLGVDQFYLGEVLLGAIKLSTLGGLGVWWACDVFRIGSAPVYAHEYRLAADLPHWVFVFVSVPFFTLMGYIVLGIFFSYVQKTNVKKQQLMQAEDEYHRFKGATLDYENSSSGKFHPGHSYDFNSPSREKSGYEVPINCYQYGACAPSAVKIAGDRHNMSGWGVDQVEGEEHTQDMLKNTAQGPKRAALLAQQQQQNATNAALLAQPQPQPQALQDEESPAPGAWLGSPSPGEYATWGKSPRQWNWNGFDCA